LSALPADASLEDIRYEFETFFGILEGTRDSEEGRTIPHEVVMAELRAMRVAREADEPTLRPVRPSERHNTTPNWRGEGMKDRVNPKQFALDLIAGMADTASSEEVCEQLELTVALLESYRDEEEGRVVPHEQAVAELQAWISKSAGQPEPSAT